MDFKGSKTMAAKIKRLSLHLRTFLMILWAACGGDGYNCPYGQNCAFEPAPPGRSPPCAQPGLTYCLHPEPYPEHVIRKLVQAGQYDIRTLLSDESRDDFGAVKKDAYPYGYGPNSLPHVDQISLVDDAANYQKDYNTKFHARFNHDIYSEKTPLQPPTSAEPTPYNIKAFQATNFSKFGFQGYHTSPSYWNPTSDYDKGLKQNSVTPNLGIYNPNYFSPNFYQNYDSDWLRQASSGVTQYNPSEWWKYITPSRTASDVTIQRSISFPAHPIGHSRRRRNAELVQASANGPLTGAEALRIALGLASEDPSAERPRRQTANSIDLCQVRTQFVQPQAAQNNKGNWRYVVNMPDNMTQLVRVETCMSSECSGLCSIPRGYTSRCEQKYIQKRLVALQPSGQTLYTDVFWIPSCCQCTIVNNN